MAKLNKQTVEYYSFYCPGCEHRHVYSVSDDNSGWNFNGNMERPSFIPSLLNTVKDKNEQTGAYDVETFRCHLFVTDGKIRFLGDCTHKLAGQTVELQDI